MTLKKSLILFAKVEGLKESEKTLNARRLLNQSLCRRNYTVVENPEDLTCSPTLVDLTTDSKYEGLEAIRSYVNTRDSSIRHSLQEKQ